jgi:hypothetical protein
VPIAGRTRSRITRAGRPLFRQFDMYMVRGEVWRAAGMDGWTSGYLCTPCLAKRLDRELVADDYLVRPTRATGSTIKALANPDYVERQLRGRESDTFGLVVGSMVETEVTFEDYLDGRGMQCPNIGSPPILGGV